jgi:hypothetical protein
MREIIVFLTIPFFFFTCIDEDSNYYDEFEIKKNVDLNLIEYSDLLGISMQLLKKDSLILINDFRGDSLIHVFDIEHLQLFRKIVPVGNGPNEFISPLEIQLTDSNLYIFYRQTSFLYSIPCSMILEGNQNIKKLFQISPEANHLYPLSDSIFISSGFYQSPYVLIDKNGGVLKEFGEYPAYWVGEDDIPINARAMFHQTCFLKHPQKQLLLAYSSHIIKIYDEILSPYGPVLVQNKLMGKYSYKYTVGDILSTEKEADVERGIVCVAGSHKYIYVVYDPNRSINDDKGSQICIYDWNGNAIELLQFNKNIRCLIIDEEERIGYVIAQNPDDSLMYFNL